MDVSSLLHGELSTSCVFGLTMISLFCLWSEAGVWVCDVECLDKRALDLGFYREHHLGTLVWMHAQHTHTYIHTRTHLHPPKSALQLHWAICHRIFSFIQRIAWGPVISHWTKAKRFWLAFHGDRGAICLCTIRTILG